MLKRKLIIIITGLLLLISSAAFAGELNLLNRKPREIFAASEFKLGYQGLYLYYDEPDLMHEKGFLNGGFASWTAYFTDYKIMTGLELEGEVGSMRYDGQYSDGTPLKCDTDDYLVGGRALIGRGFEFNRIGVTPYTGFGIRHWYDKIKAVGGYERYITQYYLPLGVNVVSRLKDKWSVGGTLEGDLLLFGNVQSKLSQVGPTYEDADNNQEFGSGIGGRISLFAEYDLDGYSLGVEPYFRYWYFSESENDRVMFGSGEANVVEPKNKFYMSGIRLYVKF